MTLSVNDVPWVSEHERPVWHRPKDDKESTPEMACGLVISGAPLIVRQNPPPWMVPLRCKACLDSITDLCIRYEPRICRCGKPATHAEVFGGPGGHSLRVWCDTCVPMSGHYESCPHPCRTLICIDERSCETMQIPQFQYAGDGDKPNVQADSTDCQNAPLERQPCVTCGHTLHEHGPQGKRRCKHGTARFTGPIDPCPCRGYVPPGGVPAVMSPPRRRTSARRPAPPPRPLP